MAASSSRLTRDDPTRILPFSTFRAFYWNIPLLARIARQGGHKEVTEDKAN